MADDRGTDDRPDLLAYRPWRGRLRGAPLEDDAPREEDDFLPEWLLAPARAVATAWPVARTSLELIFRRKLFWGLYALAMMVFLLFFFGQYLGAWARDQAANADYRVGGFRVPARDLVEGFRGILKMNGTAETYRNFFFFQGYMVMVVLALAGSALIGNDLRFGSLSFYLSKPLSRWHYLLGKGLAVAVFINLLTTLPALILFAQFGFLEPGGGEGGWWFPVVGPLAVGLTLLWWVRTGRVHPAWLLLAGGVAAMELAVLMTGDYYARNYDLALGILGYGGILTVSLTLVLLATATWLQKTVPLVMTWTALLFFCRALGVSLVDALRFDARWRLIDLWNSAYLLGNYCLRIDPATIRPAPQPAWYEAALVLGGVSLSCLTYLVLRIRAVEIVK